MSDEPIRIQPGEIEDFLGSINDTDETATSMHSTLFSNAVDEDIPPEPEPIEDTSPFEGATTPLGDGQCRVCGAPTFRPPGLTKAGNRRRAPRYCDLHTPHASVSHDGPSFARLESQLSKVQQELADDVLLFGTLAAPLLPVTGYFVCENADEFTTALLQLFKNNQRVLRVFHRAAQISPVYKVGRIVAGAAYSVQVDRQQADPHNTIGQRLGVERAWEAVYSTDTAQQYENSNSNGYQPPPRYATIQ